MYIYLPRFTVGMISPGAWRVGVKWKKELGWFLRTENEGA